MKYCCIFDLSYGKGNVRPDREMGYKACQRAISGNAPLSGNVGAGMGASLVMEKAIADAVLSSKIPDEEYLANI